MINLPPQTHTIDVETVRGWVRLELTENQIAELRAQLAWTMPLLPQQQERQP